MYGWLGKALILQYLSPWVEWPRHHFGSSAKVGELCVLPCCGKRLFPFNSCSYWAEGWGHWPSHILPYITTAVTAGSGPLHARLSQLSQLLRCHLLGCHSWVLAVTREPGLASWGRRATRCQNTRGEKKESAVAPSWSASTNLTTSDDVISFRVGQYAYTKY